jgi:predicted Zn-dependent protease
MPAMAKRDRQHLDAAEGWLGLGSWKHADEELADITPEFRAHPAVLRAQYEVFAASKNWEGAVETARALTAAEPESPFGSVHTALALHEMERTREALNTLLPIAANFPKNPLIAYNVACYYCNVGNDIQALAWLQKAFELAGDRKDVRVTAQADPDLQSLWGKIGAI